MKVRGTSLKFSLGLVMAIGSCYIASAQAPTVTYNCKAKSLKAVLQEVGASSGYTLSAAGHLANVPIILDIKDMPLEKFMDHIAKICHGEWMKSGETITLTRTPKMTNALLAEDQTSRVAWIKEGLAKLGTGDDFISTWNREAALAAFEKEMAEIEKLTQNINGMGAGSRIRLFGNAVQGSPATTAAVELIKQMPAERIAAIQPGQRVVFTNHPNQMQVALPFRAEPTLERFRAANNMVASVLAEKGYKADIEYMGGVTSNRGAFNGRFGKTLLIVQRTLSPDPSVSITAIFTAEDGTIIGQAEETLWGESTPRPKDVMSTAGLEKITLTKLSTEIAQLLTPANGDGRQNTFAITTRGGGSGMAFTTLGGGNLNPLNMSPEALAMLTNPAKFEPLLLFPSEIVLGAAKAKNYGVIAVLPDSAFQSMMVLAKSGTVDPANFLDQLASYDLKGEVVDNVQILSPIDPLLAERTRMNRPALETLIQTTYLKKYASLDDICKYITVGPEISGFNNLDLLIVGAVAPVLRQQLQPGPMQSLYMKLYGSMTPQQRGDGQKESRIPFNTLMPQQRQYLNSLIFGSMGMAFGGRGKFNAISVMSGGGPEESLPSIRTEPTEALPNGLPANSFIQMDRNFSEGLFAIISSGKFGTFMQPMEVGMMNGFATSNPTPGNEGPAYTKFQLADLMTVQLQYRAPEFERGTMFSDGLIRSGSLAVSQEQLPSHILAQIKEGAQMGGTIRIGGATGGGGTKQP